MFFSQSSASALVLQKLKVFSSSAHLDLEPVVLTSSSAIFAFLPDSILFSFWVVIVKLDFASLPKVLDMLLISSASMILAGLHSITFVHDLLFCHRDTVPNC